MLRAQGLILPWSLQALGRTLLRISLVLDRLPAQCGRLLGRPSDRFAKRCPQGFFVPYLAGGVSLVVLAVGSTAPGLLNFFTDKFQALFPDFRDRVLRHEAGHFLVRGLQGSGFRVYNEVPWCGGPG